MEHVDDSGVARQCCRVTRWAGPVGNPVAFDLGRNAVGDAICSNWPLRGMR